MEYISSTFDFNKRDFYYVSQNNSIRIREFIHPVPNIYFFAGDIKGSNISQGIMLDYVSFFMWLILTYSEFLNR